jgi:DNA polymerase
MNSVLHLDFETASGVDLKTVGVENYCMHRDFEVTATAWAFDDDPVQAQTWPDTDELPPSVRKHIAAGGPVKAWNAAFERSILRYRYNLLASHEQMDCVMQRASAWGLPMSLQDAGDVLNVPTVKDRRARSLMLMMGKPRKDGSYWHKDPDPAAQKRLADLTAYCMSDVDAERALDEVIPPLAKFEKLLSIADAQINREGVRVDLAAVAALRKAVEIERARIDAECAALTNGAVTSPGTQTAKLVAWLTAEGWGSVTDLTKATITELLGRTSGHVPVGAVRRVLFLRQLAARASVAKLDKMEGWASVIDGRARNLLQFYGAGRTGRWAGLGRFCT